MEQIGQQNRLQTQSESIEGGPSLLCIQSELFQGSLSGTTLMQRSTTAWPEPQFALQKKTSNSVTILNRLRFPQPYKKCSDHLSSALLIPFTSMFLYYNMEMRLPGLIDQFDLPSSVCRKKILVRTSGALLILFHESHGGELGVLVRVFWTTALHPAHCTSTWDFLLHTPPGPFRRTSSQLTADTLRGRLN